MTAIDDVPGREGDLERLVEICRTISDHPGAGRIAFVVGGESSGRRELLRALADELSEARRAPVVFAGSFVDGRYIPRDEDPTTTAQVLGLFRTLGETGERIAGALSDVGVPYSGLVRQVLAHSARPLELLEGLSTRAEPPELAPAVLRRVCQRGPVAWIVDDADLAHSGGIWADLVLGLADSIAHDLRLALILGMDGPRELGDHDDDEPDSLYVARELTREGGALWLPLMPIGREELRQFTGPASPKVLDSLVAITGGEPAWAGALWREWQRHGMVHDLPQAEWEFAPGGHDAMLGDVDTLLAERLKHAIGEDLRELMVARRVLACAALEGQRFTAPAIADALELDRDTLIDFLDDSLSLDDRRPDGVVDEDGWVEIRDERGHRALAMYRFARVLDWLTLARRGVARERRQSLAQRLADALVSQYGGQSHLVAHRLVRLYTLAGSVGRATHYRRLTDVGTGRQVILWRAHNVLAANEPTDHNQRRRAAQILLAASNELFHTGPFADGLAFAQAAVRLTPLGRDQAEAVYLSAVHRAALGDHKRARSDYHAALERWRELGDRLGEASTRYQLALLEYSQSDFESARRECIEVLELRRALRDRPGETRTRQLLANIDFEQGEGERARTAFVEILQVWRELGDRRGEAVTLKSLARIDLLARQLDRARSELISLLELWRELDDRHGEADTRRDLAVIDYARGHRDRALSELRAVLELQRKLGDSEGGALTLATLSNLGGESADS